MNQALSEAQRSKPRMLVCAPSNAAVDNIILKIMEDGFIDGRGQRYNPSMVRIGVGQSDFVSDVALEQKVDAYIHESQDIAKLEQSVSAFKIEQYKIRSDISKLRRRLHALATASPYALSAEWEIRIDEETFDTTGRVFFVNHTEKRTSFDIPPPPRRKGEKVNLPTAMPEYQAHMGKIVKLVERFNVVTSKLHRVKISQKLSDELNKSNNKSGKNDGNWNQNCSNIKQLLETHVVDNVHIVLTTLGTAGNRILEQAMKFEVVVIDEAAQSVEPATLVALQLGSSHAILVGDPQQLPATIFSVSGRETKYDRSLFQRLEEAGYPVHMLNTQYRMHPQISCFPRKIFYSGNLKDGPNVMLTKYGNPLREIILKKIPVFQPFTVLDLDSEEERSKQNGTRSLSNSFEARLALHLYLTLEKIAGLTHTGKVAVITPYSQQAELLRKIFYLHFGDEYTKRVEVNTVDAFQGREANIVIFSCVRAAGSTGIGFLSDVRRMNVALTRAKFFLFVIARCESIVVNPYWRDLVRHAMENKAVLPVPLHGEGKQKRGSQFPEFSNLAPLPPPPKPIVSVLNKRKATDNMINISQCDSPGDNDEDGEIEELF